MRDIPRTDIKVISPGHSGVLADQHHAAFLRDSWFNPTSVSGPTIYIIDLRGNLASVSFLHELILPLGQSIKGGAYDHPVQIVVITHDPADADFLGYLAKAHSLPLYVERSANLPPLNALYAAQPVGDLTSTEHTTLNLVLELGGTVSVGRFANGVGIGHTAAGNRLVNLTEKGYLYRFTQPQREGHVYVHPCSYGQKG